MTINADVLEHSRVWLPALFGNLSPYEYRVLAILVASKDPLRALEINLRSGIPRTKVYGTLKRLVKASLAEEVIMSLEDLELPDIWEYWPEKNRIRFLNEKEALVHKWRAVMPTIFEKFALVRRDFRSLCKYIDLLEADHE